MNNAVARWSLILLAVVGVAVGWAGVRLSLVDDGALPSQHARAKSIAGRIHTPDSTWRATLLATIDRAPFRASRRLAEVAYDPNQRGEVRPPLPALPPKPSLLLSGIVWEREPAAVIEGFPDIEGPRVVRRGDVVGGLTIQRIRVSDVVIAGLDTVWHLTVRTSWQ